MGERVLKGWRPQAESGASSQSESLTAATADGPQSSPTPTAAAGAVPASPPRPVSREKAIAFSRPEQLAEIFSEANRLKLQVLIRTSNTGKAVRGVVEGFELGERTLRIGAISAAGDACLRGHDLVKIEFILLSKKLVFVSPLRARVPGKILVGMPEKIVAIERRVNARFRVPASHAAFVEFPERNVDTNRYDIPYVPPFLRDEHTALPRFRIDDVSLGGVACFTRFQGVSDLFRAEEEYVNASLHFPGQAPLLVPVSVRWTKKTTAALGPGRFELLQRVIVTRFRPSMSPDDADMRESYYRMGLQFHEVPKELDAALRQFLRVVQTAESI